jgi:tetratricopeptide (TPR) repeat protein
MVCMMNFSRKVLDVTDPLKKQFLVALIAVVGVLLGIFSGVVYAQSASLPPGEASIVEGTVRSSAGKLLKGASVLLEEKERSNSLETKTKADGSFVFSGVSPGVYTLRAKISGWCEGVSNPLVLSAGDKKRVDLVLESLTADHPGGLGTPSSSGSPAGAMEFEDKPNFTVAGVTDWNNTGMHGSDVSVRTSETLAKETLALKNGGLVEKLTGDTKAGAPSLNIGESQERLLAAREQVRTMLAKADTADGHRLMGELNERLGDPLEAVREYERAALMDPSEQNYFEWGTELLLHRADGPAAEVFTKGSHAHPDSARMLAGFGAALYAEGKREEAAARLCEASDLKPADPAPYVFLGKMEKAATGVLACVEQKLARFAQEQPGNALANYYYGVTLWKRGRGSEKNAAGLQQAEALLEKTVNIDPKLGEAYLQLGILHSERGDFEQAIRDYKKAIEVNPQLSEAHYRLGSAYRRIGEESKAEQEFRVYEKVEKAETAAIESRRRELRQFLIILKDQPAAPSPR